MSLKQATGLLFLLGCFIALIFTNRDRIHPGGQEQNPAQSPEEAFNGLVGTAEYDRTHGVVAQEFLLHAATIETVDQTGKLDWGVNWLEFLFINPIPRVLFPNKPSPDPMGVNAGDIFEYTSIVVAPGAASGIVSDLYTHFHVLSAIFLYGFGRGLRRLFELARMFSSPLTTVGYVMVYALSLNVFAQGFVTLFVPFCYSMVPVVLFAWLLRRKRQRTLRQQRQIILRQIAAAWGAQWS